MILGIIAFNYFYVSSETESDLTDQSEVVREPKDEAQSNENGFGMVSIGTQDLLDHPNVEIPERLPAMAKTISESIISGNITTSLLKGTHTILANGLISYSGDAVVKVPGGPTISSGTGFMFSDPEQRIFGGDLLIGSGETPHAHRGLMEIREDGKGFSLISFQEDIDKEILERTSNGLTEGNSSQ